MKVVVNKCYGGFGVSVEARDELGAESVYDVARTDERLIALIEEKGSQYVSGAFANLHITEFPDEATDWRIYEYDGFEYIIAVIDGKMVDF